MELHRALVVGYPGEHQRRLGKITLANLLDQRYHLRSICLELAEFCYDDSWTFFASMDGHYAAFVTPDHKTVKALPDFKAKNLTELLVKLDLEGFLVA